MENEFSYVLIEDILIIWSRGVQSNPQKVSVDEGFSLVHLDLQLTVMLVWDKNQPFVY